MSEKNMHIYESVCRMALEKGFSDVGCARAEALPEEEKRYLRSLQAGYFAGMHYLERNLEKRFDPRLLVENARSILCFLAPYGSGRTGGTLPSGSKKATDVIPVSPALRIASYAAGLDYHRVIKERLFSILQKIREMAPECNGRVFTDSAPVLERAWAVRAGLGFIGKSNFLISRKCGIRNFIGVIVTDLELPCNGRIEPNRCGNCTRCLKSCPSGALCGPYLLDSRKCISYQTIESKTAAEEEPEQIPHEGWYFGCDACLDACPWNSRNRPGWPEFHCFRDRLEQAAPQWWEQLDETSFQEQLGDSPLSRAGLAKIRDSLRRCRKEADNGTPYC